MINLVGKGLQKIQQKDIGKPTETKHIDVSYNKLDSGIWFKPLINLQTLIIDDNNFSTLEDFPYLKQLQTFSANKNNFSDLEDFLNQSKKIFGKLKNLSLLKNPLNPFFQGQAKYNIYRDRILDSYPKLKTIDGCGVVIMKKNIAISNKQEDQKYQKLSGTAVFDQKFASQKVKNIITRSQGNRFLKNHQL